MDVPQPTRTAHWMNRVTNAVFFLGAVLVVSAMVPTIGRYLGLTETRSISRDRTSTSKYHIGQGPGALGPLADDAGAEPLDPFLIAPSAKVVRSTEVFERPGATSERVAALAQGQTVRILADREEWVLVVDHREDEIVMGWIPRSHVAIR